MNQKNIHVYFYEINLVSPKIENGDSDYLWKLISNQDNYLGGVSKFQGNNSMTGRNFELRNIAIGVDSVSGSLSMLRFETPNIRKVNGAEEEMNLGDGETLLEKNYFIYYKNTKTLVWQFNMAASHVANFPIMLMAMAGEAVMVGYNHIVKGAFNIDDDTIIEFVDLKITTPKNSIQKEEIKNLNPTDWSINPFKIMSDAGARQFSIQLRNSKEEGLASGLLNFVRDATGINVTKKLKVKVSGAKEPIDMLSERFTYREAITYNGRNPTSDQMFQALLNSKGKYDAEQEK